VAAALSRILALIGKELIAMLKDPRTRVVLFLPPLLESILFGYAASYDLSVVRYAVLDQDRSEASRTLLARLDGSGVFEREANLVSPSEIAEYIDARRVLVVVHIPQHFGVDLSQGGGAKLQVIGDGRNSNTAGTALGYVANIVEDFQAAWADKQGTSATRVRVLTRAWYNPQHETRWHMIPSLIGTLTMLQTLLLTAMSVAREREEGTFDQLLVTPLRPYEIMVGKALPAMMVGLFQATLILLVGQLWFEIPFMGSFLTLYVGLVLFVLAAVGIGLMVSALVATMQQAMLFSFVLLMPFILLSGLATPIENMPEVLQRATALNPLRYAISITERVYLEGAGFLQVVPDLWPLAGIAAFTLPMAAWVFRKRVV
jgi:ABC-2 type transport system permease protein